MQGKVRGGGGGEGKAYYPEYYFLFPGRLAYCSKEIEAQKTIHDLKTAAFVSLLFDPSIYTSSNWF